MGTGIPESLGVALASQSPVLCIVGDGGFHLKNPLYIGRDYRFHDNLSKVVTELYKDKVITKSEKEDLIGNIYSDRATFDNLRKLLHDKYGYDGIIYRNNIEDRGSDSFMGDTYFTPDYFNADGYAGDGTVYEVYLSIKRPLIVDGKDKKWDDIETEYGTSTREVVANVDRSKYDGIIFINIKDAWFDDEDYQDSDTVYVTFRPNQIKSVENDGTWDIGDDNIFS
jgi:hypothetical protein